MQRQPLYPATLQPPVRFDDATMGEAGGYDPSAEYRRLLELTAPGVAKGPSQKMPKAAAAAATRPGGEQSALLTGAVAGAQDAADAYQQLMARERRVLDTVDRIVNDAERGAAERDIGGPAAALARGDMPAHEVLMRTAGSVRLLFEDLVACRSMEDVRRTLLGVDRSQRPFLGLALIALAALLAMLYVAAA